MKKLSVLILVLLCSALLNAQDWLKTNGKAIINSQGDTVLLRGMGLGGWWLPEGYMIHGGRNQSPTQIRQAIDSLIGPEKRKRFYEVYERNHCQKVDIDQLAKWKFNSIRLPMHFEFFAPKDKPGTFSDKGFILIDSLITWCKANKMWLILDMHAMPGGQSGEQIADAHGVAELWMNPANQELGVEIWTKIAKRYANEPVIAGYDLINETHWDLGDENKLLREYFIRLTKSIREVDQSHIIFIEGNGYATDFRGLTPVWDSNMAYSFHRYWNPNTIESIQPYLNLQKQTNVPLWLGETGENSNTWFHDSIQLIEGQGIGWAWWPLKKVETVAAPLQLLMPESYKKVTDYWAGNGPKPTPEEAEIGLMEIASGLAFGNLTKQPDVIDAMMRPDYGKKSKAFRFIRVPAVFPAVWFDLGRQGVAYNDSSYQFFGVGSDPKFYNTGRQFRNDGVDINFSNDPVFPFEIMDTKPGEWVNYTFINENESKVLKMRVLARTDSEAEFSAELGNTTIGTGNINAGKNSWVTIGTFTANPGFNTIKLIIKKGSPAFRAIHLE